MLGGKRLEDDASWDGVEIFGIFSASFSLVDTRVRLFVDQKVDYFRRVVGLICFLLNKLDRIQQSLDFSFELRPRLGFVESFAIHNDIRWQTLLVFHEVLLDPLGEQSLEEGCTQVVPAFDLLAVTEDAAQVLACSRNQTNRTAFLSLGVGKTSHCDSFAFLSPVRVSVWNAPQGMAQFDVHLQDNLRGARKNSLLVLGKGSSSDHLRWAVESERNELLELSIKRLFFRFHEEDNDIEGNGWGFLLLVFQFLDPISKSSSINFDPIGLTNLDSKGLRSLLHLVQSKICIFLVIGRVAACGVAKDEVFEFDWVQYSIPERDAAVFDVDCSSLAKVNHWLSVFVAFQLFRLVFDAEHEVIVSSQLFQQIFGLIHALLSADLGEHVNALHHSEVPSLLVAQPSQREHLGDQIDVADDQFLLIEFLLAPDNLHQWLLFILDDDSVLLFVVLDVSHIFALFLMVKLALRILLEVYLFNFVDLHVAELDQNRGVLVLLVELVESELLLIVLNGGEEVLLPEDLRNGVDLQIELVVDGRHIDLVASPDVEAGLLGDVIADGVGIEVAAHGQFLHVLFLELVLGIDIEDLADGDLAVGVLHDEVLQADLLYWLYYDIEFKLFGALSKFRNKSQCLRVVLPAPDHLALEADVAQVLLDVVVDRLDDLLPQGGTVAGQLGLDEKRVLVDGAVLLLQLDGVDVGVEDCGFGVLGGGPGALAGAGHQHTCQALLSLHQICIESTIERTDLQHPAQSNTVIHSASSFVENVARFLNFPPSGLRQGSALNSDILKDWAAIQRVKFEVKQLNISPTAAVTSLPCMTLPVPSLLCAGCWLRFQKLDTFHRLLIYQSNLFKSKPNLQLLCTFWSCLHRRKTSEIRAETQSAD